MPLNYIQYVCTCMCMYKPIVIFTHCYYVCDSPIKFTTWHPFLCPLRLSPSLHRVKGGWQKVYISLDNFQLRFYTDHKVAMETGAKPLSLFHLLQATVCTYTKEKKIKYAFLVSSTTTHSLTHSLTYSLTHSLPHLLTLSSIHSLTLSLSLPGKFSIWRAVSTSS